MSDVPWWRGATIYQIYPRSFLDTDGNGVGDLPGIIAKLDYIAGLGVDAIWISPFFKSPMADFGYDIADYRAVDPLFGTLDDFDRLLAKAHALGLRVMIDQVLSHTSAEHAWFKESRSSRDNPKADWYVWADPREDGTPPNNWMSLFGGVAWHWEPRRGQYYLHNFLSSQPDLNFHNPEVRAAVLDVVRFWLDRGVDGLRLDAINFCFHDKLLRDNPAKPADRRVGRGFSPDNPYAFQYHYYNNTQPENLAFLKELRGLLDQYPGAVSLGEISSEDSLATMAEYTTGQGLHMAYSFELLTDDFSAAHFRHTIHTLERAMPDGWPCWAISNHDVRRVISRWGGARPSADIASMLSALLCCLRGSACIYQGEELGLTEADVPYEALQDPYGKTFWPTFKGRDGCRTPMPWDSSEHAGFSSTRPWLPIPADHLALSVARQERSTESVLQRFRHFMQWRKAQHSLRWGDIAFLETAEPVLVFTRSYRGETLLLAFNLSDQAASTVLPVTGRLTRVEGHGLRTGALSGQTLQLPAYGCLVLRVE
ncbi:MAG: alpha-glucosidase family protein [Xanthomonadaceae bacterium]|nr:alpha-glucosidase family protein [Xanthomonadaceae bacterium]